MKGKLLPIEEQVCDMVRIIINHHGRYQRKYSRKLIHKRLETGRRSHKFYDVHFPITDIDFVVTLLNQIIPVVASNYFAVSRFNHKTGTESIVIYPWDKEVHYEGWTTLDTKI